ncbi:MAG: lysoplasmalogenase [Propionibacteriaceae bacterium]|jgi:hypothetical protein|nr:lysoplasmalogenase [Propionibacteriaceae bacterium]
MPLVILILGAAASIANMIVRARGASWLAFTLKTISGALFCILGFMGLYHIVVSFDSPALGQLAALGVLVCIGLFFGLLGDIVLSLKDLVPSMFDKFLTWGFVLFALGHVAFIAGLIRGWDTPFPWVPIGICAVVVLGFVVCEKVLKLDFGNFKWVVAGYGVLLTMLPSMGFFTLAFGTHPEATISGALVQPLIMAIAGISFMISDLVLAWTYFGPQKDRPWEHVTCYVFYYLAQFAIAGSLLFV